MSCTAGLEEEHLFNQDLLLFVLVVQGEFEENNHLQEYVHVEDVGYTHHQHHPHDHCQVCVLTLGAYPVLAGSFLIQALQTGQGRVQGVVSAASELCKVH